MQARGIPMVHGVRYADPAIRTSAAIEPHRMEIRSGPVRSLRNGGFGPRGCNEKVRPLHSYRCKRPSSALQTR
jgi:hypothetical protein